MSFETRPNLVIPKSATTEASIQLHADAHSRDLAHHLDQLGVVSQALTLVDFLDAVRARTQNQIKLCFEQQQAQSPRLLEAMQYACLNGGKRLRPALIYGTYECILAADRHESATVHCRVPADEVAIAVEFLHCYSLIHDDLPAMDDDDLRRGRPTCHRAYDEATAILAGDALQSLAFEVLAGDSKVMGTDPAASVSRLRLIFLLARASGLEGMAAGQALDLGATGQQLSAEQIQKIHELKTGSLMQASVEMAALAAADLAESDLQALRRYAAQVGLAFQVQDDILDETGRTERLGKSVGVDSALSKATYPAIMGLQGAEQLLHDLLCAAEASLETLSFPAKRLSQIARFIVERDH